MNYIQSTGDSNPVPGDQRWHIVEPQNNSKTDDFSLIESLVPTEVAVGASVAFRYPMPPILLTYRGSRTGRIIRQELNA